MLAPAILLLAQMPLTFNSVGTSSSSSFSDGFTVSRIGAQPPRPKASSYAKFGPAPIEVSLRRRKTLQPSMSDPVLAASAERFRASLVPRIHGSPAGRRLSFLASRSIATASDFADGHSSFNSTWPAVGLPALDVWPGGDANCGGGRGVDPGEARVSEPWLGMLTGGQSIQLPEDPRNAIKGTQQFVDWYKAREMQIQHDRDECAVEEPQPNPIPWSDLLRESHGQLMASEEGSAQRLRQQAFVDILDHLQESNTLQGLDALGEALIFRFGTHEFMRETLDFRHKGEMSLMEFAGAMSILGLDIETICGVAEYVVFSALTSLAAEHAEHSGEAWRSGCVRIDDLAKFGQWRGTGRKKVSQSRQGGASHAGSVLWLQRFEADLNDAPKAKAQVKWISIARWMGRAVQRSRALRAERQRTGWQLTDDRLEEEQDEQAPIMRRTTRVGLADPKSTPSLRGEVIPGLRAARDQRRRQGSSTQDVLFESGAAMRELERRLRGMFKRGASIQMPEGPQLMTRQDLHAFFEDMTLADPLRPKLAGHEVLDMLFQEAVQIQIGFTKISDGITFWSFKALLNNAVRSLNLGWPAVTDVGLSSEAASEL